MSPTLVLFGSSLLLFENKEALQFEKAIGLDGSFDWALRDFETAALIVYSSYECLVTCVTGNSVDIIECAMATLF